MKKSPEVLPSGRIQAPIPVSQWAELPEGVHVQDPTPTGIDVPNVLTAERIPGAIDFFRRTIGDTLQPVLKIGDRYMAIAPHQPDAKGRTFPAFSPNGAERKTPTIHPSSRTPQMIARIV